MKANAAEPIDLARLATLFRQWLAEADHVLVGAGAGMSAAAGIDYTDPGDFARVFPHLARRGFSARYQLIGFRGFTPAQHWAYWATHVANVRVGPRPAEVYARLRELLAGKDVFVVTSNVDAMFERNGFDPERIFTPQGDYANMQCRTPCRPVVWPSAPDVQRVLAHIDPATFAVTSDEVLPRCPSCGGEVFLNVRLDRGFVETPYRAQAERLQAWLARARQGRLLLLEVGAGFNTPGVVRQPLERLAAGLSQSRFVRVNRDHAELGHADPARGLSVPHDAGAAIAAFAAAAG